MTKGSITLNNALFLLTYCFTIMNFSILLGYAVQYHSNMNWTMNVSQSHVREGVMPHFVPTAPLCKPPSPRGKRDGVIQYILERENGNWTRIIA